MFIDCLWKCFECLKKVPIFIVVTLVVWSYYVYLFHYCYNCLGSIKTIAFRFIPYHVILFLFFWSFLKTAYTPIQRPPEKFFKAGEQVEKLEADDNVRDIRIILSESSKNLPIMCRNVSGAVRYCSVCRCFKPDRCHHCSVCGTCVLKMDHHCPWVNNCVGFMNYKFFVLFLFYGLLYCLFISYSLCDTSMSMLAEDGLKASPGLSAHLLFLWLLSSLFSIGLFILTLLHVYLLLVNKTTLELFQIANFLTGRYKKAFHLGVHNNFTQVFGRKTLQWFLPVHSSLGDGTSFPVNPQYADEVDVALKRRLYSMPEGALQNV